MLDSARTPSTSPLLMLPTSQAAVFATGLAVGAASVYALSWLRRQREDEDVDDEDDSSEDEEDEPRMQMLRGKASAR